MCGVYYNVMYTMIIIIMHVTGIWCDYSWLVKVKHILN